MKPFYHWLNLSTLVGWVLILWVGLLGFLVSYERPRVVSAELSESLPPIEWVDVELSGDRFSQPQSSPAPEFPDPPALLKPLPQSEPLPLVDLAMPSEDIVFALPTPITIMEPGVEKEAAAAYRPDVQERQNNQSGPSIEPLTFGSGQGNQPAPRYPSQAIREGQEGEVNVVFTVAPSGRVVEAEAVRPCPWPMLNREALRVIKDRWRFPRGETRRFQVTIRFELTQ